MTGDEPGADLATVHQLHPGDPPDVVEAELISDEEYQRLTSQKGQALARRQGYRADVAKAYTVTKVVATHSRTRATGRLVLRNTLYVPAGAGVVAKRIWEARTNSLHQRQIRAAEARGDMDMLLEWEARDENAKERRHKRTVDWLKSPIDLLRALALGSAGVAFSLLALGILLAVAKHDAGDILAPIQAVLNLVAWMAWVVAIVWGPLILVAPWLAVLTLWHIGRKAGVTPAWLATSSDGDDITIDETTVARALGALRIGQITTYLKDGNPLQFITTCRLDGRGTHCVVRLPSGVQAATIARRRADLATGLHRLAKEVWPTTGAEAGILDLWIADKGALAEGAGPYPLLEDGAVDVFKGVPFGKTLRGTPILAPLMERNTLCGGIPGQGKSSAARAMMAGAALDPTAELRIWVPDSNFDFEAFRPRCSRYVMGAEDAKIEEILLDLRELHHEIQVRGELLVRYETPAVTREIANKGVGLHPLFCLLEEAHVAIEHPDFGAEIGKLLVNIVRLGRKRGIHMLVSTQAPTKASIPRDVTRNCSNGIAFAVGDHIANDALLGQGAYSAGHRATELIPGADQGTAVVKGFTGERSDIVQVYFISVDNDSHSGDQITPIIRRSLDAIARRKKAVPGSGSRAIAQVRDLLDDVFELMGDAKMASAADMARWLRGAAPNYQPYASLNGVQLKALLDEEGAPVTLYQGTPTVYRDRVRDAMRERGDSGG